jgi:hypothetical protein
LSLAAREQGTEFRAGIGTPKSLVQKLAARVGREPAHVALLVALSRAVGIWDPSATNISAPPGSFTVQELTRELFVTWRRGGAWDEAREEAEVLRLGPEARDTSPAGVVRELVLEALQELGEGRWLPWSALERYLSTDHRAAGLTRLLRRWAERVGAAPVSPVDIAYRIVHESLPALGLVDLGDEPEGDERSVTLRMTPRGRALLAGKLPSMDVEPSKFLEAHVLRLGPSARVGTVLTIAPLVEVGRVAETLDLIVAPQSLARALAAGLEADVLRARIEALAELPESLVRTLAQASVVLARTTFAAAGGFLWVEDSNVRELLRTRRPTAELFVDPSPPGGLLVQASVDLERLARRCRTLGVEIVAEGQVVRIRSVPPPKSPAATRGGDRGPSS